MKRKITSCADLMVSSVIVPCIHRSKNNIPVILHIMHTATKSTAVTVPPPAHPQEVLMITITAVAADKCTHSLRANTHKLRPLRSQTRLSPAYVRMEGEICWILAVPERLQAGALLRGGNVYWVYLEIVGALGIRALVCLQVVRNCYRKTSDSAMDHGLLYNLIPTHPMHCCF